MARSKKEDAVVVRNVEDRCGTNMEESLNTLDNVNIRLESCGVRVDQLREWYSGAVEPPDDTAEKCPMEIGGQLGIMIANSNRARYLVARLEDALSELENAR